MGSSNNEQHAAPTAAVGAGTERGEVWEVCVLGWKDGIRERQWTRKGGSPCFRALCFLHSGREQQLKERAKASEQGRPPVARLLRAVLPCVRPRSSWHNSDGNSARGLQGGDESSGGWLLLRFVPACLAFFCVRPLLAAAEF